MSEFIYRLSGDARMYGLAALTPEEAGADAARILREGAKSVEIERVPRESVEDLEDVWGTRRFLERHSA